MIMLLSEGQMSDQKGAAVMIDAFPRAKALLADWGYDGDWSRAALEQRGIAACILSKTTAWCRSHTTRASIASATRSCHVRQTQGLAPHQHPL